MIVKATFKLGNVTYDIQADASKAKDALHEVITISSPRSWCAACNSEVLPEECKLTTNKDKDGNIYVNAKHTKKGCGARSGLGTFKAGGYFWKDYEIYKPANAPKTEVPSSYEKVNNDDMPF